MRWAFFIPLIGCGNSQTLIGGQVYPDDVLSYWTDVEPSG